jgi:hypothetical protein
MSFTFNLKSAGARAALLGGVAGLGLAALAFAANAQSITAPPQQLPPAPAADAAPAQLAPPSAPAQPAARQQQAAPALPSAPAQPAQPTLSNAPTASAPPGSVREAINDAVQQQRAQLPTSADLAGDGNPTTADQAPGQAEAPQADTGTPRRGVPVVPGFRPGHVSPHAHRAPGFPHRFASPHGYAPRHGYGHWTSPYRASHGHVVRAPHAGYGSHLHGHRLHQPQGFHRSQGFHAAPGYGRH